MFRYLESQVIIEKSVHGYVCVSGGGTPYIQMIGMIAVFFRGCNRRFSIF